MNLNKKYDLSDYEDDEAVLIHTGGLYVADCPTIPFSFTLRKVTNSAKSDEKDYQHKFDKFKALGVIISNFVFEKNHTNAGIHAHGVMQIPKKFNMKRFRTRGWHISLKEIYDKAGWDSYMAKEQILAQNESEDPEPQIKMPTKRLF